MTTIVQRFGIVLFWIGVLLAAATLAGAGLLLAIEPQSRTLVAMLPFAICALLFWLAGRALRYVFSGVF